MKYSHHQKNEYSMSKQGEDIISHHLFFHKYFHLQALAQLSTLFNAIFTAFSLIFISSLWWNWLQLFSIISYTLLKNSFFSTTVLILTQASTPWLQSYFRVKIFWICQDYNEKRSEVYFILLFFLKNSWLHLWEFSLGSTYIYSALTVLDTGDVKMS